MTDLTYLYEFPENDVVYTSESFNHFILNGELYYNEVCLEPLVSKLESEEDIYSFSMIFPFISKPHEKFIHWVINESDFARFYLTKDTQEGYKNGFEMDVEEMINVKNSYLAIDAVRIVRLTYEFEDTFNNYLGLPQSVGAHIEAVLNVVKHIGLDEGHTLSSESPTSFTSAIKLEKDPAKYKEYIKCAV